MNLTSLKFTNRDLLLIIDVQNDFVSGVLGTKRAQALIPDIAQFIRDFPGKKIFTMVTHQENYLSTQEGRNLPIIHTVEGTHGWELIDEIKALVTDEDIVFRKKAFGSMDLACELIHHGSDYDNIYVIGFDTIYCVLSNVVIVKAAAPEVPIHVIASLCACASRETHKTALSVMKTLQVDIIDDDVLDNLPANEGEA